MQHLYLCTSFQVKLLTKSLFLFLQYIAIDRFAKSESSGAFAVIDGHGGVRAAEYCRENLGPMLESHAGLEKNTFRALKDGKHNISLLFTQIKNIIFDF